jgi:hypothetical protein
MQKLSLLELRLHVWRQAPHTRQANPVGGCPPQFAHSVVSCNGETQPGRLSVDRQGRRATSQHISTLAAAQVDRRAVPSDPVIMPQSKRHPCRESIRSRTGKTLNARGPK